MVNLALKQNTYEFLRKSGMLRRVVRESLATYRLLRNKAKAIYVGGLSNPAARLYTQSIPTFDLPLEAIGNDEALISMCEAAKLEMSFGRHALYLPPQEGLRSILGEVVDHYPPNTGFKILRRFLPPSEATYLCDVKQQRVTNWVLGPVTNQALAAGGLHAFGLGPECHGVVHLRNNDVDMTAFAVRHVDGESATPADCEMFRERIENLVTHGVFEIVPGRGLSSCDFQPPSCNGNLFRERATSQIQYVDFQQLVLNQPAAINAILDEGTNDLHFGGSSRIMRGGRKYLYQSVPNLSQAAKRDCSYRWQVYEQLLAEHDVQLTSRVVLDICCNSGMMMTHALSRGADWCVGWDLPNVVPHTTRILNVLGSGRCSLVPANLNKEYQITNTIPDWIRPKLEGSIVLYLAAIQHIGIIRDLANVPWKALLFEGHQSVSGEDEANQLKQLQQQFGCHRVSQQRISDGDCGYRTVALFLR